MRDEERKGLFKLWIKLYYRKYVYRQMDIWKHSSLIPLEHKAVQRADHEGPSPGWNGQASLKWEFLTWQMGIECLLANIFPLITNYTRERALWPESWKCEIWSAEICSKDGRLMCDVRQLARRPIRPGGQQLLTADLRGLGEDPGRGIRKGSGRGEIRRTMLWKDFASPSLLFLSFQIRTY